MGGGGGGGGGRAPPPPPPAARAGGVGGGGGPRPRRGPQGAHGFDPTRLYLIHAREPGHCWAVRMEAARRMTYEAASPFGALYVASPGLIREDYEAFLSAFIAEDAELAAVQRIVAGEQFMTIYKSYKIEAEKAAEVAVDLANGEEITGTEDFDGVASFIFDPVVLTTENIEDTVVKDGLYSVEDICTGNYADACAEAGLS